MKRIRGQYGVMVLFFLALSTNLSYSDEFKFGEDPTIEISTQEFEPKKHRLTKCGEEFICLIDKKPFWGTDGKIPKVEFKAIWFKHKGAKVELDRTGMYDPLIDISDMMRLSIIHYYGDSWKVRGRFSDGAGAYFVEWLVTKNGSIRTVIGGSESLSDMYDNWFGLESK